MDTLADGDFPIENILVPAAGALGTLADYITTQIGLRTAGIKEMNPLVNPILEGIFAVAGPLTVSGIGELVGAPRSLRLLLMAIPASIPGIVAIHNIFLIASVKS